MSSTAAAAAALLLLLLAQAAPAAAAPAPHHGRALRDAVDNLAIDSGPEEGTTVLAPTTGYTGGGGGRGRGRQIENRGFGGTGSMSGGGLGGGTGGIGRQTSFRGRLLAAAPQAAAHRQLRQVNSAVDNIDADVGDSLAGTPNAFRVAGFGRGFGGTLSGGGGAPGGFRGRRAARLL